MTELCESKNSFTIDLQFFGPIPTQHYVEEDIPYDDAVESAETLKGLV